jgi:hypothetical protein
MSKGWKMPKEIVYRNAGDENGLGLNAEIVVSFRISRTTGSRATTERHHQPALPRHLAEQRDKGKRPAIYL